MGFWGIEVKPGKPCPYHADNVRGVLHVTQATLGIGSSTEKSILQCASGHKSPVFLCSLLPNKVESCPLNLEFDDDDLVAFSVIGSRSIHLSGYFVADDGDDLKDDYEYDSLGEDIVGTETEGSSEYDSEDEYADGFFDDSDSDIDMYPSSPARNSGVVIEEIEDDNKPENGDDPTKQLKKREQSAHLKEKDSENSQLPIVVRGETNLVLESEDEDGFPVSTAEKGKSESQKAEAEMKGEQAHKKTKKANKKAKTDNSASLKRKVESADEDEQLQDGKKKKKKNKLKEHSKGESAPASGNSNETNVTTATPDEKHPEELKTTTDLNKDEDEEEVSNSKSVDEKKKKKKKKKKTKESEGVTAANQIAPTIESKNLSTSEKKGKEKTKGKPSQVRTFPNGLVVEELFMGKPDGKKAAPGKKVSVKYIGKLKKDGKIFDSNVGRAPFKFRLGVGQVIKGWEVGVNGMRIGDKRRITIPPSMGYADKRVGSIPPNSWLVFDVELVDVDR